jgi:hypothetical protein
MKSFFKAILYLLFPLIVLSGCSRTSFLSFFADLEHKVPLEKSTYKIAKPAQDTTVVWYAPYQIFQNTTQFTADSIRNEEKFNWQGLGNFLYDYYEKDKLRRQQAKAKKQNKQSFNLTPKPMNRQIGLIKDVLDKKGYAFFTEGELNMNLIYERKDDVFDNRHTDICHQIYKENGIWKHDRYNCSTLAGRHWVQNFFNGDGKGTGVLKENQYRGAYLWVDNWTNFHRSPCLVQTGFVEVLRDKDKNNRIDRNGLVERRNDVGINCHWAEGGDVDRWSAACMVHPIPIYYDWAEGIRKSARAWGNRFSLTLIHSNDFV